MEKSVLIGIGGASGSGKTFLARLIQQHLGLDNILIISEDAYYEDLSHLEIEKRCRVNFDDPQAFDHELLISQLRNLLRGKKVLLPNYDYKTHTRLKEGKWVEPKRIILLEGILIFHEPVLRDLMLKKIYINTDADICFIRRLQRDMRERGREARSVIEQYLNTVRPMYKKYIQPTRRYADIVTKNNTLTNTSISELINQFADL